MVVVSGGAAPSGRVVVVGSANVDLTATVDALPRPGQTVIARQLEQRCGGKGANQAAAAGRLGARVRLVAAVGADERSAEVRRAAEAAAVEVQSLHAIDGAPTGTALITVDSSGENSIVVVPGANAHLGTRHVEADLGDLTAADVVVVSLEIPFDTAATALRTGRDRGAITILNPSPLLPNAAELLSFVDVVILNEGEAGLLGPATADRGDLSVVVTLGGHGARVRPAGGSNWSRVPAPTVDVVDTTGCGDAFAGAIASELAAGADVLAAADVAVRYAALAATAPGAQSSYADRAAYETWSPSQRAAPAQ